MDEAVILSLNGARREVRGLPPTTTLLDWLRGPEGLTGTKEGCAEGDCGACTVVVRSLDEDGALRQRTANACIQLLPMLHGKEVVTVEGIAPAGDHPIQRAVAEGHGSQCGFCTPGFVMSLWHAGETGRPTDADSVADQIAGNLCRCTGYGPILAAPEAAAAFPPPPKDAGAAERIAALGAGPLAYEAGGARVWSPRVADDLAALIEAHPDATILAGATDIGLWVTKQGFAPEKLIHLGDCADLDRIETQDGGALRFGAAVSHERAMEALGRFAPDLHELWRRFASPQVRGAGTLCGNVANGSPIGDAPPALIALGATLTLRKGAARRDLPLEDFFVEYGEQDLRPGEFVESVTVPRPAAAEDLKIYKLSKRFEQDITAVLAAIHMCVEDGRIAAPRLAFGGMAGTPKRAVAAEAALEGAAWGEAAFEAAASALAEDFAPLDDHRASAAYRMRAAGNLIRKYRLEREGGPIRVAGAGRVRAA
ncbi:MAG: xanthine dehydrogenase small subunit [Pseudomonadota bacterium]